MTFRGWFRTFISTLAISILVTCCTFPSTPVKEATLQPGVAQPSSIASSPSANLALNQLAEIDPIVTNTLTPKGPGVAVLLLKNNQIVHAKGYGFANIDSQQRITPETTFDLASVSKQITAIALLKLVQVGKIDLAAPVTQYLPEFYDRTQSVTTRHLLHHTSGLADYSGKEWDGTDKEFAQLDLEKHLRWLNQHQPHRPPGIKFEYNNSGYALLALIVQRVAQKPFWQFAQDDIFAPLGMAQTQILHAADQKIPNRSLGYLVGKAGSKIRRSAVPTIIQGDGNVFSSIVDLAKYDIALRTDRLISPELKAKAFSLGQFDNGRSIQDEGEGYGFGWYITANYIHHSGSWYGTSTYYRHYLQQPVTLILLSNDENYSATDLADKIADLLKL